MGVFRLEQESAAGEGGEVRRRRPRRGFSEALWSSQNVLPSLLRRPAPSHFQPRRAAAEDFGPNPGIRI
eukprot:2897666-Pyramimonas_sp.AAC.1